MDMRPSAPVCFLAVVLIANFLGISISKAVEKSSTPVGLRAESGVVEALRVSELARSAMDCAQLAGDKQEKKRLSDIARTAGRDFLSSFEKLKNEEQAQVRGKMNFAWWPVVDGSADYEFRLGRLWEGMEWARDDEFDRQDELNKTDRSEARKHRKEAMYIERNCTYIH
jgi:hypothetical protein